MVIAMGRVTRINKELGYGMVWALQVGTVYFSLESELQGVQFKDLRVNDIVEVVLQKYDDGIYCKTLVFKQRLNSMLRGDL